MLGFVNEVDDPDNVSHCEGSFLNGILLTDVDVEIVNKVE